MRINCDQENEKHANQTKHAHLFSLSAVLSNFRPGFR